MLDESIDDTSRDQVTKGALGNEAGEVVDVAEAGEAAVAVFGVAVAEDDIAQGFVRQRIHEGGVMGGEEDAKGTSIGDLANFGEEVLGAAGVDAVVDFFDNDEAAFGGGEEGCDDREDAEGSVGEEGDVVVSFLVAEGFGEGEHDFVAGGFDEADATNGLFGEALDEVEDGLLVVRGLAEVVEDAGEVAAVASERFFIFDAVFTHC